MRELYPPAIVEKAVDLKKLAAEARKLNIAIRDGEALVERETESLAQRRERLGKILVDGRGGFNKRGDGFVKWVEGEIGIPFRTANDYMRAVGYEGNGRGMKPESDYCELRNNPEAPDRDPDIPPSNIESLIADGVPPREAAMVVANDASLSWMDEMERLVDSMRRSARSLFSSAEALDALCRQHEASVSSPAALTMHSMLVAAKTSIQKTLQLMGKEGA